MAENAAAGEEHTFHLPRIDPISIENPGVLARGKKYMDGLVHHPPFSHFTLTKVTSNSPICPEASDQFPTASTDLTA